MSVTDLDLKVLDPKGFRYGGKHYKQSDIIPNARPREANLLIAIGKAEKYTAAPKRAPKKRSTEYKTRDMKAE
jgi:hypothetical protein